MRLAPVRTPPDFDVQRHVEFDRRLARMRHHLLDDPGRRVLPAFRNLEYQLLMDLQEHPDIAQTGFGERSVHPRHRPFYEVGAGALERRVDRGTLGAGTDGWIG